MGQALGGGSITHRCKRCPCGGRVDARHIICGECTVYQMPSELQEHLANILTQTVVREQAQTGYVPTAQANVVAATVDCAASTLFGGAPPPRTEKGWRSYVRALRVICGGLPRPDRDMLRAMKQQHEEAYGNRSDRPASTVAHAATLPRHRLAGATASTTGQPPADDKPSVWKDNPEALKLARLEFKTTVLKESVRVQPPPLINPSLCDEQGNEEDSMSNSHHNFYEYKLNRCEGAAFARQCIGLSLRYVWEQLAAVLNAYEKCLHAHADSRLKIDGKHAEMPQLRRAHQRWPRRRGLGQRPEARQTPRGSASGRACNSPWRRFQGLP